MLTQRQENFCINVFKGMSHYEAYIAAGYSSKQSRGTIDHNAYMLSQNKQIINRIAELNQATESKAIATVDERKQILTEIARGRIADFIVNPTKEKLQSAALQEIRVTGEGANKSTMVKLHNPINAITELNKMERLYTDGSTVNIDNREVNITVMSEDARKATERIIEGERTNGHTDS